jgi:FAD/FMN-containing dehydrogenase
MFTRILAVPFAVLVLASSSDLAASTQESEYQSAVRAVDQELMRVEGTRGCPGTDLVLTCGDRKCDASLGETQGNCPSDCISAPVRSYNQQTLCSEVQKVHTPETAEELRDVLASALHAGQKVRVVGRLHSANSQLCTPGVVISTERFNRIQGLEKLEGQDVVSVDAGVTMEVLTEWLHERGKSLGFAIMGFRGVSIGGAVATGSHGSSAVHPAILSSRVLAVEMIDGRGRLLRVDAKGVRLLTGGSILATASVPAEDWLKAVRAHLGTLGAVTRLWLAVESQFNLDVRVTNHSDDILIGKSDALLAQVKDCDYGQLNWFPGTEKVIKTCGKKTFRNADSGAQNVLLNPTVPESFIKPVKKVLQYGACHPFLNCLVEKARHATFVFQPPFEKLNEKGEVERTREVIGPSNRMMSSVLTRHQDGFFQMDWEIAVPASKAQAAIEEVRRFARERKICLPLVGVFIRFAPSEDASLLAHTTAHGDFKKGEPVVFIEMPVYLPTAFPKEMANEYDSRYEDFARLMIERFSGRAHWGKNRDWAFELHRERGTYGSNLERFRKVMRALDPAGVFQNEFARQAGLSLGN